jgi:hypothetical protein
VMTMNPVSQVKRVGICLFLLSFFSSILSKCVSKVCNRMELSDFEVLPKKKPSVKTEGYILTVVAMQGIEPRTLRI